METQRPPHREAGDTRDETSLSLLRERQNVAIRGGGVRERRRACFMFNCVIMCDNAWRVANIRSWAWSRLRWSGSEERPSESSQRPVRQDFEE